MKLVCLFLAVWASIVGAVPEEETNRWFNGLYGPNVFIGPHSQLGQHGNNDHHSGHSRHRHRQYVNLEACECVEVIGNGSTEETTTGFGFESTIPPTAPSTTTTPRPARTSTPPARTTAFPTFASTPTPRSTTSPTWTSTVPAWTSTVPAWTTASAARVSSAPAWTTAYATRTSTPPTWSYGKRSVNLESLTDEDIERHLLDFNVDIHHQRDGHFGNQAGRSSESSSEEDIKELHDQPHSHHASHQLIPEPGPFVAPAEYVPNSDNEFVHFRRQPGFRNPYTGKCICSRGTEATTTTSATTATTPTTPTTVV